MAKTLSYLNIPPSTQSSIIVSSAPAIAHGKTIQTVTGNDSTVDSHLLISATADQKIYVCAFYVAAIGATLQTAAFQDGEDGTDKWTIRMQAPADVVAGANLAVSAPAYLFALSTNTALYLDLLAAVRVDWSVSYWKE